METVGRKIVRSVKAITEKDTQYYGVAILFSVTDIEGNKFTSARRMILEDYSNIDEILKDAAEFFISLGFIDITPELLYGCSW